MLRGFIESVSSWTAELEVQSGVYAHKDYDFLKPRVDLETRALSTRDKAHLDLDYPLDVRAEVDMNVAMDSKGNFIEVRGDIRPGDKVVIRGGERLRAGQQVNPLQQVAGE